MPVLTPKERASYEEVVITVLSPAPVTAMGLPLSSGLSRCSTEAKKASISTQTIIFAIPIFYLDSDSGARKRLIDSLQREIADVSRVSSCQITLHIPYKHSDDPTHPKKRRGRYDESGNGNKVRRRRLESDIIGCSRGIQM